MELYLIRHAQTGNNANPWEERVEDSLLTKLGHRQAARLAKWTQSLGLTQLITSPFRRALETTAYIKKATGLTPEVWVNLHEQGGCVSGMDLSSFRGCPGMTRRGIMEEFPGYRLPKEIDKQGWWKCKPYEPLERASERAKLVAQETIQRFAFSDERAAFMSHGTFMQLLLGALLGSPAPERSWLGGILNTSVTTLLITPDQSRLLHFNDVCHLPQRWIT